MLGVKGVLFSGALLVGKEVGQFFSLTEALAIVLETLLRN